MVRDIIPPPNLKKSRKTDRYVDIRNGELYSVPRPSSPQPPQPPEPVKRVKDKLWGITLYKADLVNDNVIEDQKIDVCIMGFSTKGKALAWMVMHPDETVQYKCFEYTMES